MKKLKEVGVFLFDKMIAVLKFFSRIIQKTFRFIHRRKRFAIPLYTIVAYLLLVFLLIQFSGDPDYNQALPDKRVNDITEINPIQVAKEIRPTSIQEIIQAVKKSSGPISIGGGRYSMGGQIGYENSLHIDMRAFNKVLNIDEKAKEVTVQPGIVWRDLQKAIDPYDLSIKIMQTYANFTVGGSISVNCHGRYIGHGPIISSVKQLKIVNAYGDLITANRSQNTEIFNAVVGGYGGIGVIVEATLKLENNVKVERQTKRIDVKNYKDFFDKNIRNNKKVIFQNGDLYPPNYDVVNNVSWIETDKALTDTNRVTSEDTDYWLEPLLVEMVSWGSAGKWIRRKILDPLYYSSEKVVWRNKEASYDVRELEPKSREKYTYVLQEYFIPVDHMESFIPKMKAVYDKYDVNVINVSLRHAYPDKESYLSWAREEVFAFVIYYKQGTDAASREIVKQWTLEMTDAILSENGSWYLPYQPHATIGQFKEAFSDSKRYFEVKHQQDSTYRFTNKLLDKYDPYVQREIEKERENIKGYYRDEEQTILTVPEWYLVFNPKEYADFLKAGNSPSDFPFYASIDEYWKLYDRSQALVSKAYPENEEYNTMLQVIGVSVTLEYTLKMIYENTIGRFFSWFATDTISDEEKLIIEAHSAYSNFIYHTAWYEFKFMPWVRKVWNVKNTEEESSWLRRLERKLFFSFEFIMKAAYAKLIEWGVEASYEEPVTEIFLLIKTTEEIQPTEEIKIVREQGEKKIISIKRWGAFTDNLLRLKALDIEILEIGGNDEIVVSVLSDDDELLQLKDAELLYKSDVVTDNQLERLVYFVPVNDLISFLRMAQNNGVEVEHVFDY